MYIVMVCNQDLEEVCFSLLGGENQSIYVVCKKAYPPPSYILCSPLGRLQCKIISMYLLYRHLYLDSFPLICSLMTQHMQSDHLFFIFSTNTLFSIFNVESTIVSSMVSKKLKVAQWPFHTNVPDEFLLVCINKKFSLRTIKTARILLFNVLQLFHLKKA